MRGIGSVLINVLNALSDEDKQQHSFVFFVEHGTSNDPNLLSAILTHGLDYSVKEYKQPKLIHKRLPGKLGLLTSAANNLISLYHLRFGDSRLENQALKDIDAYLQIDPGQPMPKSRPGLTKALMLHDLIPYVLEWDYLWNYSTARIHGFSRKAALRVQARRMLYVLKYKAVIKNSNLLLANSEHTKSDFGKYFNISRNIQVTLLGVSEPDKNVIPVPPSAIYKKTSWGYLKEAYRFDQTPFILFVGGADRRRKLADVIAAFNRIRGRGTQIKLVLVGDTMQGPANIATEEVQTALRTSSYLDDIIFMGFADKKVLQWLYENTAAFVFPSRYEGFGLPVLEALARNCPVISYPNEATREVAKDIPIYVDNIFELETAILNLIGSDSKYSESKIKNGANLAKKLSWEHTTVKILQILASLSTYTK